MLVGSFKYDEPMQIEIELCKRNYQRTKICSVFAYNKSITPKFANPDELTFKVDKSIVVDGVLKENKSYELITGDMILKVTMLKKVQYYIVNKCVEDFETKATKEITAYSYQYILNNRTIVAFEGVKKLFDITNPKESVLHEVIRQYPSWKIGYVNHDVNKFRVFKVDEQNMLDFLYDLQETYKCILQFDTVTRTINVEKLENIGQHKGLVFNERNYIKNISIEPDFNNIVTRLFIYGKDSLGINNMTSTGVSYLENYDYYLINDNIIDSDLIVAIKAYQTLVKSKQGEFDGYLATLKVKQTELYALQNQLAVLESERKTITDNVDVAINSGVTDLNNLYNQQVAKETQITSQTNLINSKKTEITSVNNQITTLRNSLSEDKHFTTEQIYSKADIVKTGIYRDNNIIDVEELYNEGKTYLEKISQPTIEFTITSTNFLKSLDRQIVWDKVIMGLGDIVTVEIEKLDKFFDVRLIEYTYSEDETDFVLRFSNKASINDPQLLFDALNNRVSTTSATVDINKFKFGEYSNEKNTILDYINGELDLSKQQAIAGHNNDVKIGDRGIMLINKDNSNYQTLIQNNKIVFTEDGWRTVKTSISNGKVIADNIIGKLLIGNELIIGDAEGTFNILGNKLVIRDRNGNLRIMLGELEYNKFGLRIYSSSGNVVLDEDGILQTWQEGRCDNVAVGYPLKLHVFIPETTKSIRKAILRFKRQPIRTYSGSAQNYFKDSVTSTSGLTGSFTSNSGGGEYVSTTTNAEDWDYGENGHNHGLGNGVRLCVWNGTTTLATGERLLTGVGGAYDTFIASGLHTHRINMSIPAHQHPLPSFSHSHTIPSFSHSHDIVYGIFEGTNPSNTRVIVNGVILDGTYNTDQFNINLANRLTIGAWNEIQLTSGNNGRIDATVFIQAMMYA